MPGCCHACNMQPAHMQQASLGHYEEALEDAQKVVELKPDWPKGYSRVGAAALGAQKYDEAIAAYEKGAICRLSSYACTCRDAGWCDAKAYHWLCACHMHAGIQPSNLPLAPMTTDACCLHDSGQWSVLLGPQFSHILKPFYKTGCMNRRSLLLRQAWSWILQMSSCARAWRMQRQPRTGRRAGAQGSPLGWGACSARTSWASSR